jgi:small subunit ribosomal protein S1
VYLAEFLGNNLGSSSSSSSNSSSITLGDLINWKRSESEKD